MKYCAIVFARYNSNRLPGKVLYEIDGKPILKICLDKLATLKNTEILVATSKESSDEPIWEWCKSNNISFFKGDLNNVARRTVDCLLRFASCNAFFRINADSPFLQTSLLEKAMSIYEQDPAIDIVTNLLNRTHPYGVSVELIRKKTFIDSVKNFDTLSGDFEHITQYFYRNEGSFRIRTIASCRDFSDDRWVLDTQEDWRKINKLWEQDKTLFDLNVEQLHHLYKLNEQ